MKNNNTMKINRVVYGVALFLVLIFAVPSALAAPTYRMAKAKRSLNTDRYTISIQKNSQVDIYTLDGSPRMDNAFPAIAFSGKTPRPLDVDYRRSTRVSISNGLGKGNGLLFQTPSCEWRIATYPGQPFITVDLTYVNATRKPVEVAYLMPWTLGERAKGALFVGPMGSGGVRVFPSGPESEGMTRAGTVTNRRAGHVAAASLLTQDVFVAGFIAPVNGGGYVELSGAEEERAGLFRRFSAVCTYDPPIRLKPGESLRSDTFYLSIGETTLPAALRRYVVASKRMDNYPRLASAYRHGWNGGASADLDGATLRATMDRLASKGSAPGWSHVHLGKAWMSDPTTLTVDENRFPEGLAALTAYAHRLGLTLGVTVPLLPPDVSALSDFIAACDGWGVDSIELEYVSSATSGEGSVLISPGQLREALKAAGYAGRHPVYVRPVAVDSSGVLQEWAMASRQFYLPSSGNPLLTVPGIVPLQEGSSLTDGQFVTAFSLAALQGANLRPTTAFCDQPRMRQNVLARLVPGYRYSARPIDLLAESLPQQWYLPLKTKAGRWSIVGLFNWDTTAPKIFRTPLPSFGLNAGVRYTVYDFWAGRYLGMIKDLLQVEVPPEGVRLLGLRYAEQRPMLVASNRHYTQGALDHRALTWSYDTQTLSGRFEGVEGFPYTLTFHIPEAYRLKGVDCSEAITGQREENGTLSLSFSPTATGVITWSLQF